MVAAGLHEMDIAAVRSFDVEGHPIFFRGRKRGVQCFVRFAVADIATCACWYRHFTEHFRFGICEAIGVAQCLEQLVKERLIHWILLVTTGQFLEKALAIQIVRVPEFRVRAKAAQLLWCST